MNAYPFPFTLSPMVWEAMVKGHYQSEMEIDAVVTGFEQCTTGKSEFTHLSHLTVAVYYLRDATPEQTVQKMSAGLFRFLDHRGVSRAKFNEQLTRTWIALVQGVIEQLDPKLSLVAITNTVLERLGDSRIAPRAGNEHGAAG